jgi:hypothetical protein
MSQDLRRPNESLEDLVSRRVAQALTARLAEIDALAGQAEALPDGAVSLDVPEDPLRRRLDGRAASRLWEVRCHAEDVLRDRDPDVAWLRVLPQDADDVAAALEATVMARALWIATGMRAALREEAARAAKGLGRRVQPLAACLPAGLSAPGLDGFEAVLLPHAEGRRLVLTSRTVLAAWPFWALDDVTPPRADHTGPGAPAPAQKTYVLPPGPPRPGAVLPPPRR